MCLRLLLIIQIIYNHLYTINIYSDADSDTSLQGKGQFAKAQNRPLCLS